MKKFTLIENAKDSLEHVLSHVKSDQDFTLSDSKKIILDLAHIVELLLKEKLRRVDPLLVYKNIDPILIYKSNSRESYTTKNTLTVDVDIASSRLKKIKAVELSKEDKKAIKQVKEKRNEIAHFEFEIDEETFKLISGEIMAFILRFSDEQLGLDWASSFQNHQSWHHLIDNKSFYENLLKDVNRRIEVDELYTLECPWCNNTTFSVDNEECLVCGAQDVVHECKVCKASFLDAELFNDEKSKRQLCEKCEWEEGYAMANCERC